MAGPHMRVVFAALAALALFATPSAAQFYYNLPNSPPPNPVRAGSTNYLYYLYQ